MLVVDPVLPLAANGSACDTTPADDVWCDEVREELDVVGLTGMAGSEGRAACGAGAAAAGWDVDEQQPPTARVVKRRWAAAISGQQAVQ